MVSGITRLIQVSTIGSSHIALYCNLANETSTIFSSIRITNEDSLFIHRLYTLTLLLHSERPKLYTIISITRFPTIFTFPIYAG